MPNVSYFASENVVVKALFVIAILGLFFVVYEYLFLSYRERHKEVHFGVFCLFLTLFWRRKFRGRI